MAGVRGVDQRQVWALRTFGAGRLAVVRRVVLPAALASIIAGLRLSFGQAWRTLVGAEFLAAFDAGLGYLIYSARQFLAIDVMFTGLVTLGVFGFLLVYWLVGKLEELTVVRWGMLARR
jgi:taurine transport system permease protein